MKGYDGNKTVLPLVPESSIFSGRRPIIAHLIENLPPGPRTIVVNHCQEDVMAATKDTGTDYCRQPQLIVRRIGDLNGLHV